MSDGQISFGLARMARRAAGTDLVVFALGLVLGACSGSTETSPRERQTRQQVRGAIGEAMGHPEACLLEPIGCSASLIAPNVVLTAAHCVVNAAPWHVRCPYSSDPEPVEASEGEVPPSYPAQNGDIFNPDDGPDIGLIRLDRPLRESRVGKVRLGAIATGSSVYMIGRVDKGVYSDTKLFVSPMMSISAQDTLRRYWIAVDQSVAQDGDSGGALILAETGEIIGADSMGRGSCPSNRLCEYFGALGADPVWFNSTLWRFARHATSPDAGEPDPSDASAVSNAKDVNTMAERSDGGPESSARQASSDGAIPVFSSTGGCQCEILRKPDSTALSTRFGPLFAGLLLLRKRWAPTPSRRRRTVANAR